MTLVDTAVIQSHSAASHYRSDATWPSKQHAGFRKLQQDWGWFGFRFFQSDPFILHRRATKQLNSVYGSLVGARSNLVVSCLPKTL